MAQAIEAVAVLGAGTMGSQIAVHIANAGIPVLVLDITTDAARAGVRRVTAQENMTADHTRCFITTGNFGDDLHRIAEADWVIEAVIEHRDTKQKVLRDVDQCRRAETIISSNTSGFCIAKLAEGLTDGFRRLWLGTHFFNPVHRLRLLEVVPTQETSPQTIKRVSCVASQVLAKRVVIAKDTPGFIGNRISLYHTLRIIAKVAEGEYSIDEADAITGPVIGRPKSATFRRLDLAGIDVLGHLARELQSNASDPAEMDIFTLPRFVTSLIERGWVGHKAGQGFYKCVQGHTGVSSILTLDPVTMDYVPRRPADFGSLTAAVAIEDVAVRIGSLVRDSGRVGEFLRTTLVPTLAYVARITPCIAHSADDVDEVMRLGFGWKLGPFELIRALGMNGTLGICADP